MYIDSLCLPKILSVWNKKGWHRQKKQASRRSLQVSHATSYSEVYLTETKNGERSTWGKSMVDALPSCENMSWSLLTRGITDCPKNGDETDDAGNGGTVVPLAADPDDAPDARGWSWGCCDMMMMMPFFRLSSSTNPVFQSSHGPLGLAIELSSETRYLWLTVPLPCYAVSWSTTPVVHAPRSSSLHTSPPPSDQNLENKQLEIRDELDHRTSEK
jgi:hypothetical protein